MKKSLIVLSTIIVTLLLSFTISCNLLKSKTRFSDTHSFAENNESNTIHNIQYKSNSELFYTQMWKIKWTITPILISNINNWQKDIKKHKPDTKNPKNVFDYTDSGMLNTTLNKFEKAEESFNKAISLDDKYSYAYNDLGVLYALKNNDKKTSELFEKAIELDNIEGVFYSNLANYYSEKKQFEKAVDNYKTAIIFQPGSEFNWYNLGLTYFRMNQPQQAYDAYKIAYMVNENLENYIKKRINELKNKKYKPDFFKFKPFVFFKASWNGGSSASMHLKSGFIIRFKEFENNNNKGKLNSGNPSVSDYLLSARKKFRESFEKPENYDLAIEDYKKAIDLYPEYPYTYNSMGIVYLKQGKNDLAIDSFNKAIELAADQGAFYNNLAVVSYLKDDKDSCFDYFLKALALDPKEEYVYENVMLFLEKENRKQLAEKLKKKLINENYKFILSDKEKEKKESEEFDTRSVYMENKSHIGF